MANNPALHLMRQVEDLDEQTLKYLQAEGTRLRKFPEADRPKIGNPQPARYANPSDSSVIWVDNNWSRDEWVTIELMNATTGFVIVDNSGQVLATFAPEDLGKAEKAYKNSKINIQVDFDLTAEAPAAKPRRSVLATA